MQSKRPVTIKGAKGPFSESVNGTFVPTAELLNGKPVYYKEGRTDCWLFYRSDGKWAAGTTSSQLAMNAADAGTATSEVGLAHPAAAKLWQVSYGFMAVGQYLQIIIMVRA